MNDTHTHASHCFPVSLSAVSLAVCSCIALFLPAAGGAAETITLDVMRHVIAIGPDGGPRSFTVENASNSIPAREYDFSNHVETIIRGIEESGRTNILLYLFGGMNSVEGTTTRAAALSEAVIETSEYYPLSVVWASSLFNCYFDHVLWIRRGVREPVMGPLLSPFYLMADVGRAITRLPITLAYHGYAVASGTVVEPVEDDAEDDEAEIEAKKIRAATGRDRSSITMRIFQRIVYAAGMPFRIITVPAIDACGKNAWDVMLARVLTAFHKSSMIDMPDDDEFEIAYKPPDGALGVLMNRLVPFLESNRQYRVTIIGHSLGALIGNELVRSYPALPCDDIVYMGAASTVRETAMTVMPFLRTHTNCTFYNLCLHQHADAKEYMWFMILPSGSILEWVDTFLSDPLTAEDLTVGKWKNAIRSLPSLEPGLRKRIVIKAFGIDDPIFNKPFAGMPEAHTDFSSPALRFWERSFWNLPPVWTNRTRAAHGGPTRLPH